MAGKDDRQPAVDVRDAILADVGALAVRCQPDRRAWTLPFSRGMPTGADLARRQFYFRKSVWMVRGEYLLRGDDSRKFYFWSSVDTPKHECHDPHLAA